MNIIERVIPIQNMFDAMDGVNASAWQRDKVQQFKREFPHLIDDLNFCFEVLAGKHKLGFTVIQPGFNRPVFALTELTIQELYQWLYSMTATDKSYDMIHFVCASIPKDIQTFMVKLLNRTYRLGYTNRNNMVTDKHCMLANKYPDAITSTKDWYVQEKLNGNRCIAYFEDGQWQFMSRSQKPMKVHFNMVGFDTTRVYDGEVMTRDKMGNRDFSRTSGLINAKYADKSELMYFIYDILDDEMPYKDRRAELLTIKGHTDPNVVILKVLDKVTVYPNPEYNQRLDHWLDYIVDRGGEGVMLRDPMAPYHHSKHSGDRKPYLLKYKKTKTCDLRIVGWNEGKGKYVGMIGSFICEDDKKTLRVSVAGITDEVRASDPEAWIGKIIEVAYFEMSQSQITHVTSLQFPRFKRVRDDKTETSLF